MGFSKEELKKQIKEGGLYTSAALNALIDQLDEPEALSQKWINEHAKAVKYDGIPDQTEVVYVDELQSLLVPKQDKPVIPQFVADWIEIQKGYPPENIQIVLKRVENRGKHSRLYNWVFTEENVNTFVRANLDGYTVEKKRYYVVDQDGCAILKRNIDREFFKQVAYPENGKLKSYYVGDEDYMFTEQEIKDYDERYWPFAKDIKGN